MINHGTMEHKAARIQNFCVVLKIGGTRVILLFALMNDFQRQQKQTGKNMGVAFCCNCPVVSKASAHTYRMFDMQETEVRSSTNIHPYMDYNS